MALLSAPLALASTLLAAAPPAAPPVGPPAGPHGDVRIHELLAVNGGGHLDQDGDASDWIEIWNAGAVAVDLGGWHLSDDAADLTKWTLPSPTPLAPGAFLVVFASDKDRALAGAELHTNFKLTGDGEDLFLVEADGVTVASAYAPFPEQSEDVSYGLRDASLDEGYFDPPTPGAPNGNQFAELAKVRFSAPRGFHAVSFSLTLSHPEPGVVIRYTLDGSDPLPGAPIYSGPIPITGTTVVRAQARKFQHKPSPFATRTFLFAGDVLGQSQAEAVADGFPANWVEQDGTDWSLGGNRPGAWYGYDPTVIGAYTPKELEGALRAVPSVSLVLPPEDWFGDGSIGQTPGIYVNSEQSGDAWDRPGSAEWIPAGAGKGFQVNCGIGVQGGSSTGETLRNQLSLALKFRDEFGPTKLEFPLFPGSDVERFDYLVLDAGNQNAPNSPGPLNKKVHAQGLRDQYMADLQTAMGGLSPRGRQVHLYLNGLYWGLYTLHERIDHRGAAAHGGGEPEEYDWVKEGAVREGNSNAWNDGFAPGAWDTAVTIAANGLKPGDQWLGQPAYEAFQQWFDVADYADYLLLNYWGGNTDWPQNNWMGTIHARNSADWTDVDPDGRWRWHEWDAETVLWWGGTELLVGDGFWDRTGLTSTWSGSVVYFYTYLRENPEWRLLFADRAHQHLFHGSLFVDPAYSAAGTPYDPAHPERNAPAALYHGLAQEAWPAIVMEYARWGSYWDPPGTIGPADWLAERDRILEDYCPVRSDVVLAQLRNVVPALYPMLDAPRLDPPGGHLGSNEPLSMSGPAGTTIWYTTDGSDPRLVGGAVSPAAQAYAGPVVLTGPTVSVRARAFDGVEWSALELGHYAVGVRVVVNELMARNRTSLLDEANEAEDWAELLNRGPAPLDVSGFGLSDDPAEPGRWRLPKNTVIPPGGYLVVWLDGEPLDGPLHATFSLDKDGESLVLTGPAANGHVLIDREDFPRQERDVSWGRIPDGAGPFTYQVIPSPGAPNRLAPHF